MNCVQQREAFNLINQALQVYKKQCEDENAKLKSVLNLFNSGIVVDVGKIKLDSIKVFESILRGIQIVMTENQPKTKGKRKA